jgi:hypothetical protein
VTEEKIFCSRFIPRFYQLSLCDVSDREGAARLLPKSHHRLLNPKGILTGVGEKLAPPWFGGWGPSAAAVRWGLPLMERARDAQPSEAPLLVWARRDTPYVKLAPGGA